MIFVPNTVEVVVNLLVLVLVLVLLGLLGDVWLFELSVRASQT